MPPQDRPPKPRIVPPVPPPPQAAPEATAARAPHPLWPRAGVRPDTVTIYRLTRGAAPERVLDEVDADTFDGGDVTGSRALVHATVGDGVYRLDPHRADGRKGFAGASLTVVLPDGPIPEGTVTTRAGAPQQPTQQASPVENAVAVMGARSMFDEMRAAAAREHDRAGREVMALSGIMQANMQANTDMMRAFMEQARPQQNDTMTMLLMEMLRETREMARAETVRSERLAERLAEHKLTAAVRDATDGSSVEMEFVAMAKAALGGWLASRSSKATSSAPSTTGSAPSTTSTDTSTTSSAPSTPPALAAPPPTPRPVTLSDVIAKHPPVDPATVDMEATARALAAVAAGEGKPDDAAAVLGAAVLARDKLLPRDLLPDLALCLATHGGAHVDG